jgi:putative methylase
MQKRIVRKLDLERVLAQAKPHPSPNPYLEQYVTPTDVAATMLSIATYVNGDIEGKRVLDLGCGTGRLALGAAFLGAEEAVGVDLDKSSVKMASEASANTGLKDKTEWISADIEAICGRFDTVLQNPPFGVQRRNTDRRFLAKALEVGNVVYSLHKSVHNDEAFMARVKGVKGHLTTVSASPFLERFIEDHGGRIKAVYAMIMTVPRTFSFHREKRHEFVVDLYVIEGKAKRV